MRFPSLFLTAAYLLGTLADGQDSSHSAQSATEQRDIAAIQQIETEWLKTERTTDLPGLEQILADDFAGVGINGPTPGKARLLKNWQSHTGQAPPYIVETSDMHIIVRGDAALAAYTKTYTAKENGNVAHEDMTDVFTRNAGKWKLRMSRSTSCQH